MKPRLDKRTRDGLRSLAAMATAGAAEDVLGLSIEALEREEGTIERWENILRALAWIQSLRE